MNEQQLKDRLAEIEAAAAKLPSAEAYRDQRTAELLLSCGLKTQVQIAEAIERTQQWVSLHLKLGRFLVFTTTRCKNQEAIQGLTENRFRSVWLKTNRGKSQEERFADVLAQLAAPAAETPPPNKKPSPAKKTRQPSGVRDSLSSLKAVAAGWDSKAFMKEIASWDNHSRWKLLDELEDIAKLLRRMAMEGRQLPLSITPSVPVAQTVGVTAEASARAS